MSVSQEVRDELAAVEPSRQCDRLAQLSGLFHTAGRIHLLGRGEVAVHLDLASAAVARRAFALLRLYGVRSQIRTYRRHAFGRETRFQLHVEGESRALQVLYEAGVVNVRLAPLARPPKRVVARSCCRSAYLRGALMGAGSVSGPARRHLELRAASREGAAFLAAVAAAEGLRLRVLERGPDAVAYAKGADTIAGLLALAGAGAAVLSFAEQAVVADTRARANRLANADHANLVRASRAAQNQTRAIRRLQARGELERLPRPLQEIAELRLRRPTLSLRELGLSCDPPASKASAQRRLRRLVELGGF